MNTREMFDAVLANVGRVIVGKEEETRLCLITLVCRGHLLIEDVPGVGKTLLAKTLAASIDCTFRRIQFTPDLLPSDVTGANIFNQKIQDFVFRPGPIFANVLLADEINRATPKTQSALLEAMEEHQVTIDGETRALPSPFLVVATQNPIEYAGTFPLPEAQLDRFMIRVRLGYLDPATETSLLLSPDVPAESVVRPVLDAADLDAAAVAVRQVHVEESVADYVVRLVGATRAHQDLALGASVRASQALLLGARAHAASRGRDFVLPDDVKLLAPAVLAHRLVLKPNAEMRGLNAGLILAEVMRQVAVPPTQAAAGRRATGRGRAASA